MAKLSKIGDFFKKKTQQDTQKAQAQLPAAGNDRTVASLLVSERGNPIQRSEINDREKNISHTSESGTSLIPYQDYVEIKDTDQDAPYLNYDKEGEIDPEYREKVYREWENREKIHTRISKESDSYPYELSGYPNDESKAEYLYDHEPPKSTTYRPVNSFGGSHPAAAQIKTSEELLEKNTQYIFVFGYNGSGKSTILAALNLYLQKQYNTIENHENPNGIREINRLVRKVRRGKFPDQTPAGTLLEYDVSVVVDEKNTINLTFLEMAGEDLRGVSIMNEDRDLPDFIKPYLTTPDLPISFVLVADYDQIINPIADDAYQDDLMQNFLDMLVHLDTDTHNVALVISKYDQQKVREGETLQRVMEEEMFRTYNKLLDESRIPNGKVFPFSIGAVGEDPESGEAVIDELNLDDCKKILTWLISGFDVKHTGKRTLRKMLDRLGV